GEYDGHGVLRYPDGDVYEGGFVDGKRHGHGLERDKKGRIFFDGFFEDGLRHGHGKKTSSNGTTYTGEWVRGDKKGPFAITWADG
ncbi:hypothetical protein EMIHUDRAFT_48165, partial [Emiliania huxleyi CCMP1516]|uniref:Phosphatidylinositol-4-phosphate 5-kinase n=2 Tax=Emiliania huxleyi TaxID=2903 RepID=A0A0D3K1M1_EMIH1